MPMPARFVHLRLHTEYSISDGLVRIPSLMQAAAGAGMPAVAMTDQVNLFGMVKFYKAALASGIKPVVGVDLLIHEGEGEIPSRLALLCRNGVGYRNLTRLVTRAYTEGRRGADPLVRRDWLKPVSEGLIALSGAREGDVGRALLAGHQEDAAALARHWATLFGQDFYLELQRTGRDGDEEYVHAAARLASELDLPVVATNDVRFLNRDDFQAHEVRVCIQQGRALGDPRRPRRYSQQQYLRSPEEMDALFADLPEALENSVEIARRCNLELSLGENFLPSFAVPEGSTTEQHLRDRATEGLEARLVQIGRQAPEARRPYDERLQRELGVIESMGFAGYFLIVADFIGWARGNGVPVGPGRGSGAGSLVAYAIGITDLDPLAYDLLFERFLNPERVSMPDFDIDFCMEGRDRVIDYVASRYGRDRVSQIITFGTMAARAVVRDVGRVLGHPYGYVDRIAKMIPFEVGMTLGKALEQDEEFRGQYQSDEEVRELIDLARPLEGLARNAGKHAGGVVIAPSALTDFSPLYCEPGSDSPVTQFDKDDVEGVGLVKFDFLGLRTLTIIDWAVGTVNAERRAAGEVDLDIGGIPLDDAAAFDLLRRQATTAVFQLESRGMKDLIKRLRPDCFEDIVALVALFRPGPLQSGMVDDFINRKHGAARVTYPHPDVEPILKPTYGVILYQEQVMQIAQVLAGYSLGGADLLRRAMGKKKPEEMAKQRETFMQGAIARGVKNETAEHIFDLMEKFAGYGFNKSHSAAYALLTYQTTWLKAHYPEAFMAAVLSADMDHTDKIVTLIEDCHAMRLDVLRPDVNTSEHAFTVAGPGTIRYGLGAIKGVGRSAIEAITAERAQSGAFRDLHDLCRRVDLRRANRRVLEALIRAGALDALGPNRATLMARLGNALRTAEQHVHASTAGQNDLFGLEPEAPQAGESEAEARAALPEWSDRERLRAEKESLGLYLTGHPIEEYQAELVQFTSGRIADLVGGGDPGTGEGGSGSGRRDVVIAGLVVALRRQGGRRAFLTLDDRSGRVEVPLFEDNYQKYRHLLAKDALLVVEGSLGYDDFSGGYRITPRQVRGIDQAREAYARQLLIRWQADTDGDARPFLEQLAELLGSFRDGPCRVSIQYRNPSAEAHLLLGEDWRVRPSEDLLHRLRRWLGPDRVRVIYRRPGEARLAAAS